MVLTISMKGKRGTGLSSVDERIYIKRNVLRKLTLFKWIATPVMTRYLQMFMHFVSIFCTLPHLERAEREQGLPTADFLHSFAKFTLEKVNRPHLCLH